MQDDAYIYDSSDSNSSDESEGPDEEITAINIEEYVDSIDEPDACRLSAHEIVDLTTIDWSPVDACSDQEVMTPILLPLIPTVGPKLPWLPSRQAQYTPLSTWELFFTGKILKQFVDSTNGFARQKNTKR
jgi:hypothetical protein